MKTIFRHAVPVLAGLLLAAGANAAAISATDTTYESVDGRAITRTFDLSGPGKIIDLDITIDFAKCDDPPIGPNGSACLGSGAPFENEFLFLLTAPTGQQVRLVSPFTSYVAGNRPGRGRVSVRFDDEAADALGPRIQAGSFRPAEALSAFDGLGVNGTWSLYMQDFFPSDPLEYFSARLDITTDAPASVPEPGALALLGLGLLGLVAMRRRRR